MYQAARRSDLQGQISKSFCILPYNTKTFDSLSSNKFYHKTSYPKKIKGLDYTIFPIESTIEFNSKHPYGRNNGSLVRSRGFQTRLSTGFSVNYGPIDLQFQPELVWSQNKSYQGFPDSHPDSFWGNRYLRTWMRIDQPERYGEEDLTRVLTGQSHLNLNFWKLSAGISSENLWWGPGRENTLLMTNNASGFPHLHFGTSSPISTPIGNLEIKLIGGKLISSGFAPPAPSRGVDESWLQKINPDWRYLNASVLVWHPKWINGLYLGTARSILNYADSAKQNKEFFPLNSLFFREKEEGVNDYTKDQIATIFGRWVFKEGNSEVYFEYGRADASWNLRDVLMSPEHSRAYLIGFSKLQKIGKRWFEVSMEVTHLEKSKSVTLRDEPGWYKNRGLRQGYTNYGEIIGAGIGTGSNSQMLQVASVNGLNRLGIKFERIVNDNDFYYRRVYEVTTNSTGNWIDLAPGIFYTLDKKKLLINIDCQFVNSLNYQWVLDENKRNIYLSARLLYRI
ncbi:MAG: capsule assembly Wzi family protein [Cyclobacteriaceae bacterium]